MVGDPKQAIYVWNGADPKYLDLFERDFGARKITLTENFRCARRVVEAAQRLDPSYSVEGQLPVIGAVEVMECADETDEARTVISNIKGLVARGPPRCRRSDRLVPLRSTGTKPPWIQSS